MADVPLELDARSFARLTALYLSATDVFIEVSGSVRLRALHIKADTVKVTVMLPVLSYITGHVACEAFFQCLCGQD